MIATHEIKMDLTRRGVTPRVDVVQDDRYSRDLSISLYNNGTAWHPGREVSAIVRFVKADGTGGEYNALPDGTRAWRIRGNVVTVALAPQVCTAPGVVKLSVGLISGTAEINTFVIELEVQRNPGLQAISEAYCNLQGYLPDDGWEPGKLLGTDEAGAVVAVDPPTFESVEIDVTLTREGTAADARAAGARMGELSALVTNDRSSLVGAVNEVAEKAGSGAGLPMPAGAKVGQYFRVSAVDEHGAVTAVEAVDIKVETPVAYRYSGVSLPPLPRDKLAAYGGCALIVKITDALYRLYISAEPAYFSEERIRIGAGVKKVTALANTGDEAWGNYVGADAEDGDAWIIKPEQYPAFWANRDILDPDGVVYFAASDAEPVFAEAETDSSGSEVVTDAVLDINAVLLDGAVDEELFSLVTGSTESYRREIDVGVNTAAGAHISEFIAAAHAGKSVVIVSQAANTETAGVDMTMEIQATMVLLAYEAVGGGARFPASTSETTYAEFVLSMSVTNSGANYEGFITISKVSGA